MAPVTDPRLVAAAIEGHIRRADARAGIDRSGTPSPRNMNFNIGRMIMATWQPDPSFYPFPAQAAKAPAETSPMSRRSIPTRKTGDAIAVVDVDPTSASPMRKIVGRSTMPNAGDELHHFGWNACSSCLCPNAPHPHVERRYLVVPGLRSSRIYIIDTKPDPREPQDRQGDRARGDRREDRLHAPAHGPLRSRAASMSPLSAMRRARRRAASSSWTTRASRCSAAGRSTAGRSSSPTMPGGISATTPWSPANGARPTRSRTASSPRCCSAANTAGSLHFWDLHKRKHLQEIDLGEEHQLVFELRPAHDPTKAYGFVNCVISLKDLSSSIWTWYRDGDQWAVKKIITIPAEPADPDLLPPALKGFKAVPPLVTDIDLSMDDQLPLRLVLGHRRPAAVRRLRPVQPEAHRQGADRRHRRARRPSGGQAGKLSGGPQMVEISRDGKRVYFTNSLYGAIDPQFYEGGFDGWMVKLDVEPERRHRVRRKFFLDWPKGHLPHQVRLEGGDCSSDSYCYP